MQRNFLAGAKMQAAGKLYICINNRYKLLSCIAAYRRLMKTCKQLSYENCVFQMASLVASKETLILCCVFVGGGGTE